MMASEEAKEPTIEERQLKTAVDVEGELQVCEQGELAAGLCKV